MFPVCPIWFQDPILKMLSSNPDIYIQCTMYMVWLGHNENNITSVTYIWWPHPTRHLVQSSPHWPDCRSQTWRWSTGLHSGTPFWRLNQASLAAATTLTSGEGKLTCFTCKIWFSLSLEASKNGLGHMDPLPAILTSFGSWHFKWKYKSLLVKVILVFLYFFPLVFFSSIITSSWNNV